MLYIDFIWLKTHTHTHRIKPQQQYHKAKTHRKVIARDKLKNITRTLFLEACESL